MTAEVMRDMFDKIIEETNKIVKGESPRDEKLRAVCELISARVPHCDWVGFYLADPVEEGWLVLGPFVGEATEHKRIPVGRGVCGMAAQRKKCIVVDDVSKETDYLSCSVRVKSEIVVPIIKKGRVVGELDIDSHRLSAFTPEHQESFERICRILAELF